MPTVPAYAITVAIGLPAALQVRDVYTGLRMGLSREFKITRTLERLNTIIHRTRLSTKFVSLFLAEIDLAGTITYCNAGHPAPMLVSAGGTVTRLSTGGMILGPMADARYTIGMVTISPGDLLVVFSDGITEARSSVSEEEYGEVRLARLVSSLRHHEAATVVDKVFADVAEFSHRAPPEDDQTLLVVTRIAEDEERPA